MDHSDHALLQAFVSQNRDLEHLEGLLERFNMFEAVGVVRQELRHSDFLAYLLSPQQNHGLRDTFAKKLLQKVLSSASENSLSVTPIDIDTWDLADMEVLREWQNIDILMRDDANEFVAAIENKIGTGEHSHQLDRYWDTLCQRFPGWKKVGLYLTPDGEDPSRGDFVPIDYKLIADVLEELCATPALKLNADLHAITSHYIEMLRRYIVSESEIAELCRRIYRKHKKALDLIFEHRPDQQAGIREFLEALVRENDGLILDISTKGCIRFACKEWDLPVLQSGQGWTSTGRILLFEFQNLNNSLKLKLVIGPGPQEIRARLFARALETKPLFRPTQRLLGKKWNEIFARSLLSAKSYQEQTEDELREEIRHHWSRFLESELPEISTAIRACMAG